MTAPTATASSALPAGTRLGEFEITGIVGEGGFGIVYSARDSSLDRIVAIKEYLPAAFASRTAAGGVEVRSEAHGKTFQAGLSSFINEAKMLAKFSHPGLVEVFRFWEANGTAYMAMRYYRGITLREMVRTNPEVVTEQWLCETLDPILLALQELHNEKCYHRDVAPDNILVLPNGRSVLMDFGAARRIIGGMTRALTTVLKPGYAPIEQYSDDGSMAQGAWTDIYAVGGLLYHAMTGKVPVQAISRMMNDPLKPVGTVAKGQFSQNLCDVVMKCLAVMPENRYQSIDELRAALGWVTTPVSSTVILPRAPSAATTLSAPAAPVQSERLTQPPATSAVTKTAAATAAQTSSSSLLDPIPSVVAGGTTSDPLAGLLNSTAPTQGQQGAPSPDAKALASGSGSQPKKTAAPTPKPEVKTVANAAADGTGSNKRGGLPVVMVAIAAIAVIASAAYLVMNRGSDKPSVADVAATASAPATTATVVDEGKKVDAPALPAEKVETPAGAPVAPLPPPAADSPKVEEKAPPPAPAPSPAVTDAKPTADAGSESTKPAVTTGRVDLRIKPWGYVSVDGAAKVSSPPTMQLKLPPGKHEVEISNPAGAPVTKSIEVVAGKTVTLRHSF